MASPFSLEEVRQPLGILSFLATFTYLTCANCHIALMRQNVRHLLFHPRPLGRWVMIGQVQTEHPPHKHLGIAFEVKSLCVRQQSIISVGVQKHSHVKSSNTDL